MFNRCIFVKIGTTGWQKTIHATFLPCRSCWTGQMSVPTPMLAFYIPHPLRLMIYVCATWTPNFIAIWYIISCYCNASFSQTPGRSLAKNLCAVLATCSCALFSRFVHAFCLCAVLATCSCALFSGFMLAICLHAVSATCSCALFSGFVHAICLRSVSVTWSCVLFSRFVHAIHLCSVLATCLPVFCMQDSDVFLAELQHYFSGDYVLTLHRV
jgi:hypothetical protein